MRMGVAAISLLCSMSAFAEIEQIDSVCDFSTILESDGKVEAAFRFVNHTGSDISIEQVRTTCGCTATRFARTPIHNGDTAVVEVQFNPSGRPGKFEKKAYATFLPSRNRLAMTVRGKVVACPLMLRMAPSCPLAARSNIGLSISAPVVMSPPGRRLS